MLLWKQHWLNGSCSSSCSTHSRFWVIQLNSAISCVSWKNNTFKHNYYKGNNPWLLIIILTLTLRKKSEYLLSSTLGMCKTQSVFSSPLCFLLWVILHLYSTTLWKSCTVSSLDINMKLYSPWLLAWYFLITCKFTLENYRNENLRIWMRRSQEENFLQSWIL